MTALPPPRGRRRGNRRRRRARAGRGWSTAPPWSAPARTWRSRAAMSASVWASTALVGSSRTRTSGSARRAAARTMRWRWPPDRVRPRSGNSVARPSGRPLHDVGGGRPRRAPRPPSAARSRRRDGGKRAGRRRQPRCPPAAGVRGRPRAPGAAPRRGRGWRAAVPARADAGAGAVDVAAQPSRQGARLLGIGGRHHGEEARLDDEPGGRCR